MGGFCDPIAFAAAVQQTAVRKLGAPYDALSWEFVIINSVESDIKVSNASKINNYLITHYVLQAGPREGVFVKGLLLEGAGWDMDFATLVEAPPMKVCSTVRCDFVLLRLRHVSFPDVDQDAHHSYEAD
jgi:dynein heavy chain